MKSHVVESDIKPTNILLARDGSVKMCDFGISGRLGIDSLIGGNVGCQYYMPPERLAPPTAPDSEPLRCTYF